MNASLSVDRTIRRTIEWGDYWRRPTHRLENRRDHKEWLHFCISDRDLDVIINFSIVDDGSETGHEVETARVLCAVRTDGWDGDVDLIAPDAVDARAGRLWARFGASSVRFDGSVYEVHVRLARRPIEVDLTLRPVAIPSQINDIALSDGPPVHWFLAPRLIATGQVRVDGRTF